MASTQLLTELQEEVKCPICMEILKEPVTTNCGHNFCLRCISQVGEASENFFLCPICKAGVNRPFQPNKLLESLVEKIQVSEKKEPEMKCGKHNEKLLYFCKDDREFLCSVCYNSKAHKFHNVNLIEEGVQNYEKQIQSQVLEQKDKEVVEEKKQGEGTIEGFKAQVHQERLKTQEEFKRLRKNLEEEESFLLARKKNLEEEESFLLARRKSLEEDENLLLARKKNLEEEERFLLARQKNLEGEASFLLGRLLWMEQEGDKLEEQYNVVTAEQLSSSRKLTMSPRGKQQMPTRDLLEDMGVTLNRNSPSILQSLHRSQGFQFTKPTPVPVVLEKRINEAIPRHKSTMESMNKLTGNLEADEKKDKSRHQDSLEEKDMEIWSRISGENKGLVTLNPESADPELTLSQDLKTVSLQLVHGGCGNQQAKHRPFDLYSWVLGSQGLSSGHLVWEVKLQGTEKGACVVGVATEQASGQHCLNHIWALKLSGWDCQPVTESSARQNIPVLLRKVGIYLDHDHGKVIFFNPTTEEQIYTFQESFTGEVFPFFGLLHPGTQITLIP